MFVLCYTKSLSIRAPPPKPAAAKTVDQPLWVTVGSKRYKLTGANLASFKACQPLNFGTTAAPYLIRMEGCAPQS